MTRLDIERGSYIDIPIAPPAPPPVPIEPTVFVAAYNARPEIKEKADLVCNGSNDQEKINQAISMLPTSGGTVKLSEGDFVISSPIIILRNKVALEGCGPSTVIKGPINNNYLNVGDGTNQYSEIKVANLKIDGTDQISGFGIFAAKITKLVIENCIIYNTKGLGIYLEHVYDSLIQKNIINANADGIFTWYIRNCSIVGNHIHDVGGYGMYNYSSRNSTISGNQIFNTTNDGIYNYGVVNCSISGNEIRQAGSHGIYNKLCGYCTISANQIALAGANGIYNEEILGNFTIVGNQINSPGNAGILNYISETTTISGNQIYGAINGIICEYSGDCTITGNEIVETTNNGIVNGPSSYYCTISGNQIKAAGSVGIYNTLSSYCSIVGNQVRDAGEEGIRNENSESCTIVGNSIYGCGSYANNYSIYNYNSSNCTISGNQIQNAYSTGIYNENSDSCSITGNVVVGVPEGSYIIWNNNPDVVISSNIGDKPIYNEGSGCTITGNKVPIINSVGLNCLISNNIVSEG